VAGAAMTDLRGNPVASRSEAALAHAERALWRMVSYYDTPLADLDAASAADPGWALPPLMRAGFLLTLTEPGLLPEARAALRQAEALIAGATERERAHLAAANAAADGHWARACALWDEILVDHPRDALALICAHLFDFYRGDAINLRQRVARVLPEWETGDPLRPYVLGMHAFGLEECNLFPQAEAAGREALASDPRGPWAIHAVAHVMEMQGRHLEGTRWLEDRRADWAVGNGFSGHNGWHLALFHLERLESAAVLRLYDEFLEGEAAQAVHVQRLDSVALLWRLHLLGIDAGGRWQALAASYAAAGADTGFYAFNDVFALLAFIGADDLARARRLLADAERRDELDASTARDNLAMSREVGLPLMRGLLAHAQHDAGEALRQIRPLRAIAQRFGGSHAQRDLIDQTLLAASVQAGQRGFGRALLNERRLGKAITPLTEHWARQVQG